MESIRVADAPEVQKTDTEKAGIREKARDTGFVRYGRREIWAKTVKRLTRKFRDILNKNGVHETTDSISMANSSALFTEGGFAVRSMIDEMQVSPFLSGSHRQQGLTNRYLR